MGAIWKANMATSESTGEMMTETITITDSTSTKRSQSKYAFIYQAIDRAIEDGRDIAIEDFADLRMALNVYQCARRHYRELAYVTLRKWGADGRVQPKITVSPRGI